MRLLQPAAFAALLTTSVARPVTAEERLDLSVLPIAAGGVELRYGRAEAGQGWESGAGLRPLEVSNAASSDSGWLAVARVGYLMPIRLADATAADAAPSFGLRLSAIALQALLDDGLRDRSLSQTGAGGEAVVTIRWRPRTDLELTAEGGLLGGYGWGMATAVRHSETGRSEGPFWSPSLHLLLGRRW